MVRGGEGVSLAILSGGVEGHLPYCINQGKKWQRAEGFI